MLRKYEKIRIRRKILRQRYVQVRSVRLRDADPRAGGHVHVPAVRRHDAAPVIRGFAWLGVSPENRACTLCRWMIQYLVENKKEDFLYETRDRSESANFCISMHPHKSPQRRMNAGLFQKPTSCIST